MPLKYVKRAVRRVKKAVKKRYGFNKKSKGIKYGTMARDVAKLAQMINAEKKTYQLSYNSQYTGQVLINATGALCYDITPLLAQGTATDQRTGASVKLHSALYQFQINQMVGATLSNKLIIEFWINKGQAVKVNT